jgi:hypothetical protein
VLGFVNADYNARRKWAPEELTGRKVSADARLGSRTQGGRGRRCASQTFASRPFGRVRPIAHAPESLTNDHHSSLGDAETRFVLTTSASRNSCVDGECYRRFEASLAFAQYSNARRAGAWSWALAFQLPRRLKRARLIPATPANPSSSLLLRPTKKIKTQKININVKCVAADPRPPCAGLPYVSPSGQDRLAQCILFLADCRHRSFVLTLSAMTAGLVVRCSEKAGAAAACRRAPVRLILRPNGLCEVRRQPGQSVCAFRAPRRP